MLTGFVHRVSKIFSKSLNFAEFMNCSCGSPFNSLRNENLNHRTSCMRASGWVDFGVNADT